MLPTDISIVIVNWKSADYLKLCLRSVERNMVNVSYQVIVVDNASDDGCEAMLLHEFPWVNFIGATNNLGFARANNLGYRHARGRYVLFLNPDTELRDDSVERMVSWLDGHAQAGAVGARLLNSDGSLQENCVQAFPTIYNQILDAQLLRNLFPRSPLWGVNALISETREPAMVDSISGACYLVRREAFDAAGRWNEEYFMYSDDLELSYRIRRAGYAIVVLPDCEVVHHGGKSAARRGISFSDVTRRRSMAQFLSRTRGPLYGTTYRCLLCLAALMRVGMVMAVIPFAGARRAELWMVERRWMLVLAWSLGLAQSDISKSESRA